MYIACCDLEGVFVPEIWINVAEKTGIPELRLTTRDISDYDVLMKKRLAILEANRLRLPDIRDVISRMDPMEGAFEFLSWLRSVTEVVILSDTFTQFAGPLIEKLGRPTLLCNTLLIDRDGRISGYRLRQPDGKRKAVEAFQGLNYKIVAVGDSYNDINMLKTAESGILFRPPENVKREYPEFPVATGYEDLRKLIEDRLPRE
jgi:phosphoserine/homoserine phosphotransferase